MSAEHSAHSHSFLGAAHDENARRTLWVVILTFAMMVVEIAAGYITGSMALLADGFHMATHAGALGIAAGAYAFARRNVNNQHFSFGTGKVGDLAGFASALVLAMVALGIAIESVARLLNPGSVAFGEAALVAIVGLLVNIVSALMLSGGHHHGHDHHHHHHHAAEHGHSHGHASGGDNNMRAAYIHVLADALTSVLAIVALLAGRYFGWVWLDPLMGVVGAVVIGRWSYSLMKASATVLLDVTDEHVAEEIRDILAPVNGIRITDLHVWQVGPQARAAIVSVTGSGLTAQQIRERLQPVHEISHLTIECQAAS
ncbi:CDF family Co(II)/Ni(II) efflux transporter DmeF [Advenella mimigardefordensis]|uniref:Putative cation diffusion facilitator transporter protein n=1 Tax=Advenella mimigardefordensis (strain DSM 17166 / LMG 22922 / DPN7) TaxID=1247726 RepID=W0P9Z7_ADVMD|nr:CDF family Co(II)/Ni(II) efflux transporter DmeF [Advenella mimigardefordensis]AHG62312.1 putative cation diffusion facilitator transporter protein [Advenella mimigardefordensis DPN7]